jgi:hypothetical protein
MWVLPNSLLSNHLSNLRGQQLNPPLSPHCLLVNLPACPRLQPANLRANLPSHLLGNRQGSLLNFLLHNHPCSHGDVLKCDHQINLLPSQVIVPLTSQAVNHLIRRRNLPYNQVIPHLNRLQSLLATILPQRLRQYRFSHCV